MKIPTVPKVLTNVVFLWIIIGAVIVLGLVGTCHRKADSAIPPKVQKELDSLRSTAPRYAHERDSLKALSADATKRADAKVSAAHTTERGGEVEGQRADSSAKMAAQAKTAQDSAAAWRMAYEARTRERDSLVVANAALDSAQRERELARLVIAEALAASEARRERSEKLNADLEAAVKKAAQGCRVLWVAKCPSRTVVGVVGFVAGAAVGFTMNGR